MRNLHVIGRGLVLSLLAAVSACALESEMPGPEENVPADDLQSQDVENTETTSSDVTIQSTPTCNWVASYAGAWVPYYNGNPGTVDCNMVQGCNSAGVQKLQHSMNLCYGEHLVEDGDFGRLTKEALIRTQRTAGTPADGQYGPNTRRAMFHQAIAGGCIRVP